MGLLQNLRNRVFGLDEQDRQAIWSAFGSFTANKIGTSSSSLIEEGYEENVEVYSVIKKIADVSKALPWVIERKDSSGSWEAVEDTSLHELIQSPNKSKGLTWNDIIERMIVYLLASGNSYVFGLKPEGFRTIEEIDVLPSNLVTAHTNGSFFAPEINYKMRINSHVIPFAGEDIAHIRFFNPVFSSVDESLEGLSPIQVASRVVKAGNDRWDADANLLQNRGAIGLITDGSNRPMTDHEADAVQKAFDRRAAGTKNFGKTIVTNKDLKYIQMAMSSQDLQLIEKGVVNLRAICNVYGIDSSLFNDPANKTFNNRKEASKSLYTDGIMPVMDKIKSRFNSFLVANHFPGQSFRMRPDYSKIEALQHDFSERVDSFVKLKTAGIQSANDVNRALNLPISEDENAEKLIVSSSNALLESIKPVDLSNE